MSREFRIGRRGQRFFIIDYETTGLDMERSRPIELGVVVADERFNALETLSVLIKPDGESETWTEDELGAYRVHGIAPKELRERGVSRQKAAGELLLLADRHGYKPVLVSDNIQFEWHWTKWLLHGADWPFHHCGWDSSLLLEAAGVGDPIPAHRALADAGLLHAAIVRALDRTRSLR